MRSPGSGGRPRLSIPLSCKASRWRSPRRTLAFVAALIGVSPLVRVDPLFPGEPPSTTCAQSWHTLVAVVQELTAQERGDMMEPIELDSMPMVRAQQELIVVLTNEVVGAAIEESS